MSRFIRVVTVTLNVSAYAVEYLAISAVSTGHCCLLFGFYDVCGGLGFQLYLDVAIGLWKERSGGLNPNRDFGLTCLGCYLEYPSLGNWVTYQFRRVLYFASGVRHDPPHRRGVRYSRRITFTSLTAARNDLLGHDLPIPSTHDHRSRIFISCLFAIRP